MCGLLLSDGVLIRDILSSLEFNCHIVVVFPVLVDCGGEDVDGDVGDVIVIVASVVMLWDQ